MKFATALLVIIACSAVTGQVPIHLSEGQRLLALQHTAACIQQEQSTMESAVALVRGQFAGLDSHVKCFANCFLERSGLLINGVVQPSAILAQLGPSVGADKVNVIMTQCNSLKGSDNCETALAVYECYYKQNAAVF